MGPRLFLRLQRFYTIFDVIAALIYGLSIAILTFDDFYPMSLDTIYIAEGLLVSSIVSDVTSITITTILLFGFEGYENIN